MSELQAILRQVFDHSVYRNEAAKDIKALMQELVGEDELYKGDTDQYDVVEYNKVTRNRLRAELRDKINAL